jgi:lactoylglutathione lyase
MSDGAVTGFFHAGITVSDMDESLRFYRDGLGLEIAHEGMTGGPHAERIWGMPVGPVRVVFMRVPGSDTLLEIFEFQEIERHSASARPSDYLAGHICLYVDDADAIYARLLTVGVRSRSNGIVNVTAGRYAGAKAAYLIDPDGYHVERSTSVQRPANARAGRERAASVADGLGEERLTLA